MVLRKVKVLVVDDTLFMQRVISDILAADERFEVIGNASNGKAALEKIKDLNPDVVTLDVEMPIMDGISCLKEIMKTHPKPVVMISSVTYEGGIRTIEALDAGAIDFIQKPMAQSSTAIKNISADICNKVYEASKARIRQSLLISKGITKSDSLTPSVLSTGLSKKAINFSKNSNRIVGIGISTGGPPCLGKIFEALPQSAPPILVVQHMPKEFTKAMADRLNNKSQMLVKEAEQGETIYPGVGYIAPGDAHLTVNTLNGKHKVSLNKKGPVSGHMPSADVLFESLAKSHGADAMGIIMTGMGRDGAEQIKVMHDKGAYTVSQNQESCTVYGMPKAADNLGAIDESMSLEGIVNLLRKISSYK